MWHRAWLSRASVLLLLVTHLFLPISLQSPICTRHWPLLFLPSCALKFNFYVACFLFFWSQNSLLLSAFTYPFVLMDHPKLKNTTDIYYLGAFGSVPTLWCSWVSSWPRPRWAEGLVGAGGSASKIVHSNGCWGVGVGRRPQLLSLETPQQGSLRTEKVVPGSSRWKTGCLLWHSLRSHTPPFHRNLSSQGLAHVVKEGLDYHKVRTFEGRRRAGC